MVIDDTPTVFGFDGCYWNFQRPLVPVEGKGVVTSYLFKFSLEFFPSHPKDFCNL